MATQFIGLDRGAAKTTITTGTSTTSKTLEVTVNLAGNMTRNEVVLGLRDMIEYILDTRTTPFAQ